MEWDGEYEEKVGQPLTTKEDLAKLRNGDRVPGVLEGIKEGKVTVNAGNPPLEIPLSRVKQIELGARNFTAEQPAKGSVRAFFHRGGSITFQLEKWDETSVIGTSPELGKVTFNPLAFSRVVFL